MEYNYLIKQADDGGFNFNSWTAYRDKSYRFSKDDFAEKSLKKGTRNNKQVKEKGSGKKEDKEEGRKGKGGKGRGGRITMKF